jgi:hypothetical protein
MRRSLRTGAQVMFVFVLVGLTNAYSQSLTSAVTAKDDTDATQIAIPGGAGATVTGSGTAGAGPQLGFQVWHQDKYLLSSFFTFSAPQAISGQQHDFGAFLLNPPGQGTSYSFAGNKVQCLPHFVHCDSGDRHDAVAFVGIAGRLGLTQTSWQNGTTSTAPSVSGTVAYITPAFLATSKTYVIDPDKHDNVQFGLSVGPTFRYIAGDLGQDTNQAFRLQTLGTTKKSYTGLEVEFFVQLNQFQPYVRVSHFSPPKEGDISGFSGTQVVFGVNVLSAIYQTAVGNK